MENITRFRADIGVRNQLHKVCSLGLMVGKTSQRPIIFIRHSLGGLLVKEVRVGTD